MDLISLLINALLVCLVVGVVWWGAGWIGVPDPLRRAFTFIVALVALLWLPRAAGVVARRYVTPVK